jgi:hypothetical protein
MLADNPEGPSLARYGSIHRLSDFIHRAVPKGGANGSLFVHDVIALLKSLDAAQERNPAVTLVPHAGTGIWLLHNGQQIVLICPAKNFLRIEILKNGAKAARGLSKALQNAEKNSPSVARSKRTFRYYTQWRLEKGGTHSLQKFVDRLSREKRGISIAQKGHPRNFPGDVRQTALIEFKKSGSFCPGVAGKTKRHKVNIAYEPIEFDHVLPHAEGGASSALNVQVLCMECNRTKRVSAL